MYNSQYYSCEQIDQRLLQGYLDDYNTQNNTNLTKAEFLTLLFNTVGRNNTIDNLVTQIGYYECDTAAGTAAKAITVANYNLFAGGSMKVKFVNKNTANNATLNINSQGAKALYYQGERASANNSWDAEEVVEIYYDGTSYYANNVKGGSGSGVYDVSKEHPTSGPNSDGKFTLEYILNSSNVNELIPVNKRYPGMSIQFVSTSDNKYVQYRLMSDTFNTTPANWQGVDDEPTAGSENLMKSGGIKDSLDFLEKEIIQNSDEEEYIEIKSKNKSIAKLDSNGAKFDTVEFGLNTDEFVGNVNENGAIFKNIKVGTPDNSEDILTCSKDDSFSEGEVITFTDNNDNFIAEVNENGIISKSAKIRTKNGDKEVITSDVQVTEELDDEIIITNDNDEFVGKVSKKKNIINNLYIGTEEDNKPVLTDIPQDVLDEISEELDTKADSSDVVSLTNRLNGLSDEVEIIKGKEYGGYSFSTNFILSDVIKGNDMFIRTGKLIVNGVYTNVANHSSTSYVNIDEIVYLEYDNLHEVDSVNGIYPIVLYDTNFQLIGAANVDVHQERSVAGSLDLSQYPTAKYAVFNNNGNSNNPAIQMFTRTLSAKKRRGNILVGAYYFAGWSETDFPNIHDTEALLTTYSGRKPIWGWLDHASYRGEGWLITPNIVLGSGGATATITHSCLFYQDNQCKVYVRENGANWVDVTPVLPSNTKTTMTDTVIDLSSFANKTIQIGFRIKTDSSEQSAIWTINGINVVSNGSTIYTKDYTNHSNFDCEISDTEIWKPATWTRGYEGTNGYVGTTVNQKDTSIIDKQIMLAKSMGIDYFMLEWFYYDDNSTFNEAATEAEDNHIAVHAFMKSCQKLGFKFAVMITNHSPFRIDGLENWKDAFRYLDKTYFKDPNYLIVDNKPVVYVFDKTKYREAGPAAINDFFISELGYDGLYMLFTGYNSVPNSGKIVERNISDLYNQSIGNIKNWYINNYQNNVVPNITCGWDSRPWAIRPSGYARPTDWFVPDIDKWKSLFSWTYDFAKIYNNSHFKSILICAWNEYGEGSYLAPTEDDKRGKMLVAIKDIINNKQV